MASLNIHGLCEHKANHMCRPLRCKHAVAVAEATPTQTDSWGTPSSLFPFIEGPPPLEEKELESSPSLQSLSPPIMLTI